MYGSTNVLETPIGIFGEYIVGTWPGAPVFMIIMGILFTTSGNKSTYEKIVRGFKLYLLGLVLNVVRFVLPYLIATQLHPTAFAEIEWLASQKDYPELWQLFYSLDILTFAGLAFVILALLEPLLKKDWHLVFLGIIIVFTSPYLWGTGRDWGLPYLFFQPFWGDALVTGIPGDTSFPVFPWLIYPIVGMLIGRAYIRGLEFRAILKSLILASIITGLVGMFIMLSSKQSQLGDFYRMYPGATLLCIAFDLSWIALFMLLTQINVLQNTLNKLNFWSKNITLIYLVQWALIGFGMIVFGFRQQDNVWFVTALIPVFFVLTYWSTSYLLKSPRFMKTLAWFTR